MSGAGLLHPWFGPGGHPECEEGQCFAIGAKHDYRARPDGLTFCAERRAHGFPEWLVIARGKKSLYDACDACGHIEAGVPAVTPTPVTGAVDYAAAAPAVDTKKLSAVERLALTRRR